MENGNDNICTVDMNEGQTFENLYCIYRGFVLGTNDEGEQLLRVSTITFYIQARLFQLKI